MVARIGIVRLARQAGHVADPAVVALKGDHIAEVAQVDGFLIVALQGIISGKGHSLGVSIAADRIAGVIGKIGLDDHQLPAAALVVFDHICVFEGISPGEGDGGEIGGHAQGQQIVPCAARDIGDGSLLDGLVVLALGGDVRLFRHRRPGLEHHAPVGLIYFDKAETLGLRCAHTIHVAMEIGSGKVIGVLPLVPVRRIGLHCGIVKQLEQHVVVGLHCRFDDTDHFLRRTHRQSHGIGHREGVFVCLCDYLDLCCTFRQIDGCPIDGQVGKAILQLHRGSVIGGQHLPFAAVADQGIEFRGARVIRIGSRVVVTALIILFTCLAVGVVGLRCERHIGKLHAVRRFQTGALVSQQPARVRQSHGNVFILMGAVHHRGDGAADVIGHKDAFPAQQLFHRPVGRRGLFGVSVRCGSFCETVILRHGALTILVGISPCVGIRVVFALLQMIPPSDRVFHAAGIVVHIG